MDYNESAALMVDADFRGRVKVAVLKFADYKFNEDPSTPGHNASYKWAQQAFLQPDMMAAQVHPPTVMDTAVQSVGAAVTDAALQIAVEGVINKMI